MLDCPSTINAPLGFYFWMECTKLVTLILVFYIILLWKTKQILQDLNRLLNPPLFAPAVENILCFWHLPYTDEQFLIIIYIFLILYIIRVPYNSASLRNFLSPL